MKLSTLLPLFAFTPLTLAVPTIQTTQDKTDDIPYGAFPAPIPASSSLSAAATPSPDIARLGRAVIVNHCQTPIYIWSVGSTVRPQTTILPYGRYFETFRRDVGTGGIAIKISTVQDGLYTSAPQTVFAYNLSRNKVWYDLSDVFGDPFKGHPVVLQPAEPQLYWQDGVPPAGSQVRVRDSSVDLVLTLC